MRDFKTVVLSKRSRHRMLHVEADGCIVNITRGLTDRSGRAVTSVEIMCDRTTDETWSLVDFDNRTGMNVRAVRTHERV